MGIRAKQEQSLYIASCFSLTYFYPYTNVRKKHENPNRDRLFPTTTQESLAILIIASYHPGDIDRGNHKGVEGSAFRLAKQNTA